MNEYKALYGLKVDRGLLSQNDSYLVFDNLIAAYEKAESLRPFINAEVIDIYDYYKQYRGLKVGFKEFYKDVSQRLYNNDGLLTLIKEV